MAHVVWLCNQRSKNGIGDPFDLPHIGSLPREILPNTSFLHAHTDTLCKVLQQGHNAKGEFWVAGASEDGTRDHHKKLQQGMDGKLVLGLEAASDNLKQMQAHSHRNQR